MTTDRDALWRAIANAAGQVLHAHPALAALPVSDRQAIALSIAQAAQEQLDAAAVRRWVGLVGEPCWTCSRPKAEHRDDLCPESPAAPAPAAAREKRDAFIAAFRSLGVHRATVVETDMVDRIDHLVILDVHTAAEATALAAELDMPRPVDRISNGTCWVESADHRARGTTTVIQGAHRSTRDNAA